MADEKNSAQPIVDIAHPGKSAPSTNSKSVIISSRPVIQDPMVSGDSGEKPAETETAPATVATPVKKINIQPLSSSEKIDDASDDVQPVATVDTPKEVPATETVSQTPAVPTPKSNASSIPEEATEEKVTLKGDKGGLTPELEQDLADEAKEKAQKQLQKLIDSKQFFLPINTVESRRSKQTVAIGIVVSLVLAAAWLNIALDAGLITINGLQPVTHFF